MFVDAALARRLERAEGLVGSSFVEARRSPSSEWRELGGAIANCDGADSPMTQTFALGLCDPIDLAAIEDFFTARGTDTMHEVSPFAGVETTAALVERGYRPIEMSNVLVQQIDDPRPSPAVRVIDPGEAATWIETSVAGWSSDPEAVAFLRGFAELSLNNRRMTQYLGTVDGAPAATGVLAIEDGIAVLAGASTVPSARGRGAQAALLATRLADAKHRGCAIAMMVAAVGSTSQRNAERNGFRVAYTRTKWRRARSL